MEQSQTVVNKAYSLYLQQIAEISDLSERTGDNASAIVRKAVDAYYKQVTVNDMYPTQETPHGN